LIIFLPTTMARESVEYIHRKFILKIKLAEELITEAGCILDLQSITKTIPPVVKNNKKIQPKKRKNRKSSPDSFLVENYNPAEIQTEIAPVNLMINYLEKLKHIKNNYTLSVVDQLINYYTNNEGSATIEYYRIIIGENYFMQINQLVLQYQNEIILRDPLIAADFAEKYKNIEKIKIESRIKRRNYELCDCGARMLLSQESSELICENEYCGKIKYVIGMSFGDETSTSQEVQRPKHNGYETSRHWRFWMDHILGLEQREISELEKQKIKNAITARSINPARLTCKLMRNILKEQQLTHLNDNTTLLIRMCGGPSPPEISFHKIRLCWIKFNKITLLYDKIFGKRGKKPNYQYFLYKIFDGMFKEGDIRRRILDFIYLQSVDTVIKNDKKFEKIAQFTDEKDDIVYKPTDINY